jgi:hypothetical protein
MGRRRDQVESEPRLADRERSPVPERRIAALMISQESLATIA